MPIEGESAAGRKRRLAASKEGSKIVADEFATALTRRRAAERIGVHPGTLAKWEQAGVVKPRTVKILGSPTKVYDERDIEFGKRVVQILAEDRGRVSLKEAAKRARS
jgi:hypothetical protein